MFWFFCLRHSGNTLGTSEFIFLGHCVVSVRISCFDRWGGQEIRECVSGLGGVCAFEILDFRFIIIIFFWMVGSRETFLSPGLCLVVLV